MHDACRYLESLAYHGRVTNFSEVQECRDAMMQARLSKHTKVADSLLPKIVYPNIMGIYHKGSERRVIRSVATLLTFTFAFAFAFAFSVTALSPMNATLEKVYQYPQTRDAEVCSMFVDDATQSNARPAAVWYKQCLFRT